MKKVTIVAVLIVVAVAAILLSRPARAQRGPSQKIVTQEMFSPEAWVREFTIRNVIHVYKADGREQSLTAQGNHLRFEPVVRIYHTWRPSRWIFGPIGFQAHITAK